MVLFFWWVWGDPQGSLGVKRTVGPYSEGPTQGNINNLGVENSLGGWVGVENCLTNVTTKKKCLPDPTKFARVPWMVDQGSSELQQNAGSQLCLQTSPASQAEIHVCMPS